MARTQQFGDSDLPRVSGRSKYSVRIFPNGGSDVFLLGNVLSLRAVCSADSAAKFGVVDSQLCHQCTLLPCDNRHAAMEERT